MPNGRMITVIMEAVSPTDGENAVKAQYGGLRVQWMGKA